jgi:hypothetical protein
MRTLLIHFGFEAALLLCVIVFIWFALSMRSAIFKHILFNVSALFIALAFYELFLTYKNYSRPHLTLSQGYYQQNKELGYSAKEGNYQVHARKSTKHSDIEIYNARYSFDKSKRVTPNSNPSSLNYTVFLGGSFVFGEGVNDNQTLPFYYNELSLEKHQILNYGLSGYGTHQVFNITKNQIIKDKDLAQAKKVDVFYWFISPHILRSNGLSTWNADGPSYRLNNGLLSYQGSFKTIKQKQTFIQQAWDFVWSNSALSKGYIWRELIIGDDELNLTYALIKQTNQILIKSGYNFTVLIQKLSKPDELFTAKQQKMNDKLVQFLNSNDIPFIDVNQAFKNDNLDIYALLIKGDGHPKPKLNLHLAAHLTNSKL